MLKNGKQWYAQDASEDMKPSKLDENFGKLPVLSGNFRRDDDKPLPNEVNSR